VGPCAASGTRGASGGFGYKVMSLVCARAEQPVDWLVVTAKEKEHFTVEPLLDSAAALGFRIETVAGDQAYDTRGTYERISARGVVPIIECGTRVRKGDVRPPACEHGVWAPGGTDWQRREVRYRCPNWQNPADRCIRWSLRLPESRLICWSRVKQSGGGSLGTVVARWSARSSSPSTSTGSTRYVPAAWRG
jgi:hypothetical protein